MDHAPAAAAAAGAGDGDETISGNGPVPHALEASAIAAARLSFARMAVADAAHKSDVRLLDRAHLRGGQATPQDASAAEAKAVAMQHYAAVRCVGRWGKLIAATADAERAVHFAEIALSGARVEAEINLRYISGLLAEAEAAACDAQR